jgi:leader peptidase (prepilin peptidase)/N-methyltransferase
MFPLILLYYFSLFLFGATLGSFLNVCIYRIPRECMRVNYPQRSHCQTCQTQLAYFPDNLPILSWFLFRGRCRYCGQGFSFLYPAIETLTALLFMAVGYFLFPTLPAEIEDPSPLFFSKVFQLFFTLAFVCSLLVASFIDLSPLRIIPDEITLGGTLLTPLFAYFCPTMFGSVHFSSWSALQDPALARLLYSAYGALVGFISLLFFSFCGNLFLKKDSLVPLEAMGFGDIKLIAFLGAFLGWKGVLAVLFLSSAFGALGGGLLWLIWRQHSIPFGPSLALATLVVLFFPSFFPFLL